MIPIQQINNKVVLIAALDWGFGHTTRCTVIVKMLLNNSNKVVFVGNKNQCQFIKEEYPIVKIEFIDGYNINLSSQKSTYLQLAFQTKKIVKAIKKENKWVDLFIQNNKVDLIISDNRYGFRHKNVESVFMGHQINIKAPLFESIANKKLLKFINQFNSCWIVDDEKINLAGELSKPKELTIPYHYIGLLSRFRTNKLKTKVKRYDFLVIISGPKPENSLFLTAVENHFKSSSKKVAIVSTVNSKNEQDNLTYFYMPKTQRLNELIHESETVVSKAGYTTLMELTLLNKKAFLIPTKGQYEQEYLSKQIGNDNITFIENINGICFN